MSSSSTRTGTPHPAIRCPDQTLGEGVPGRVRLPDVVLQNQRIFGQIRDGDPRFEGSAHWDLDGMLERDMIRVAIAYGLITPYLRRGGSAGPDLRSGGRFRECTQGLAGWPATHLTLGILPANRVRLSPMVVEGTADIADWRVTSREQENTLASARSGLLKGKPGPVGPDK